jgi:hypothetical protein
MPSSVASTRLQLLESPSRSEVSILIDIENRAQLVFSRLSGIADEGVSCIFFGRALRKLLKVLVSPLIRQSSDPSQL